LRKATEKLSDSSSSLSKSEFTAIEEEPEPQIEKKASNRIAMSILQEPYKQSVTLNKFATGRKVAILKEHESSSSPPKADNRLQWNIGNKYNTEQS
jgi:hypothetical protein